MNEPMARDERRLLIGACLVFAWLSATLPLFSQEAYYWTYAQHPALGYVDHPPLVAWAISLGTWALGDGVLGIRLATFAAGLGTAWLGWHTLHAFGVGPRGRRLWLVATMTMPVLLGAHVVAGPDALVTFFATATILALWHARAGSFGAWLVAGLAAGAAGLAKYGAVFLAFGGAVVLLADPALRRQLRRPGPYVAVLLALAVFSPVVVWNATHGWSSFRFQTTGRLGHAHFGVGWLAEFVAGQLALLGPVASLLLVPAVRDLVRAARSGEPRALWVLAFGLPLPLGLLVAALWMQVKINWLLPCWVPLALGVVAWLDRTGWLASRPGWRRAGFAWLGLAAVLIVAAPLVRLVPSRGGPSWQSWDEIAARALAHVDANARVGHTFVFATSHHDAAQLTYALAAHGCEGVVPVLSEDVLGEPAREFDQWDAPASRRGDDAVLVLTRAAARAPKLASARAHFDAVTWLEHVDVEWCGFRVLDADLYLCRGYRGPALTRDGH